jgi:hypothetical protein
LRSNEEDGSQPTTEYLGASTMTMIDRLRGRRDAARRARDIERALRSAKSPSVRDEILAIATRYYG